MGMGASQVRLLALTSRQHEIGRQLQHYSLEKQSLTREMQKISKNYNLALQGKVLKWSNNAGVNYVDLTYSTLMRPGTANANKPVLLTNGSGKVVIDQKYKEFAEMISSDGKSGGDWLSNRTAILSKLTGIPASTIDKSVETLNALNESNAVMEAAREKSVEDKDRAMPYYSANKFATYWGEVGGHDFKQSSGSITLGKQDVAVSKLASCVDTIKKNIRDYLPEDDYAKFEKACDSFTKSCKSYISGYSVNTDTQNMVKTGALPIQGNTNNFKLDVELTISGILAEYQAEGGTYNSHRGNETYRVIKDGKDSDLYKQYLSSSQTASEKIEEYKTVVDIDNQVLTADQESLINFYDKLFTAVAENGWISDPTVSDNEYLNQMLQNNEYYITTMTKNEHQDDMDANGNFIHKNEYDYSTDLWSNTDNIFAVNDEYTRQEALTEYEYQKSIVSAKEARVDERMRNLETEQSAIKQMIQGVEQVRNKNVETYFSIFS